MVKLSQPHAPEASPSRIELADVVRQFASEYTKQHSPMPSAKRALQDIADCCTAALGGRRYRCDDCQESFWQYHVCRNRACPKCSGDLTRKWLKKRQAELLPCRYFHAVATVPAELRPWFRREQKLFYGLLMQVAAESVKELCTRKRYLGGLPGILAVLHTWNGRLEYHPHVHLLITGGGTRLDGEHWEPARGDYLVPVTVLSKRIAAQFRDRLRRKRPDLFAQIPCAVWKREWVSFLKPYGVGNDAVLGYLSRYVYRTAISNARILSMDRTHVTFRWKDRQRQQWQTVRLSGVEFLRRFLQHVLPRGFHRVRYYGLWHPSQRVLAGRVWVLLTLSAGAPAGQVSFFQVLTEVIEPNDWPGEARLERPRSIDCPYCGSDQTHCIDELPRRGVP